MLVARHPGSHTGLKRFAVHLYTPAEIVHTDMKTQSAGSGKQLFQRLGRNFSRLKKTLLLGTASVGVIPITVVFQQASLLARNAPMTDLMQGTGKKPPGKYHAMPGAGLIGGPIKRLIATTFQPGVIARPKQAIKQCRHIFQAMRH